MGSNQSDLTFKSFQNPRECLDYNVYTTFTYVQIDVIKTMPFAENVLDARLDISVIWIAYLQFKSETKFYMWLMKKIMSN